MTILTKQKRELIIDSVITKGTKIPKMQEDLKKRTEKRVREILLAEVPKEFADATKNLPAVWFPHKASESINKDVNPLGLMNMGEEECRRNRWHGQSISFEPIKHPFSVHFKRNTYEMNGHPGVSDPDSWEVLLAPEIAEAKKIWEMQETIRKDLGAFLASVRTYKQVLEKMPELENHLPDLPVKAYPVTAPIAPLLKMLTGLGFDQTAP